MNFSTEDSDSSNGILFVNFNQDGTSLCVGTKNGYKIYNLDDVSQFVPVYEYCTEKDICIIERHFLSSLIAVVSLSSPRKLTFYNLTTKGEICVKHFSNTILSLKLNRKAFVVCMEENLQIHDTMAMNSLYMITKTAPNPSGLCALSVTNGCGFLAYPGSNSAGDIQLFDVNTLQAKISIPAHTSRLAALVFNLDGSMVATASIKGTVIRVFSTSSGQTLFDFRRGLRRYVTIHSLSFDMSSDLLCASSNTETVHIFKLSSDIDENEIPEETPGWMDMFGKALTQTATYLPYQVSEVLTQQRAFSNIRLPISGLKTICRITRIQNVPHVVLASSDGFVYMYSMDVETGICSLAKQHRLTDQVKTQMSVSKGVAFQTATISTSDTSDIRKSCRNNDHAGPYGSLGSHYAEL